MRLPLSLWLLVALLAGTISLPGCSGCWGGSTTADAKKKEEEEKEKELKRKKLEKPKDDFEPLAVRMLPSKEPSPADKVPNIQVKPGHWIALQETAKANNFDFQGELVTFAEQQATQFPLTIEDTTSRFAVWSPAVLPKGRFKRLESLIYVPRRDDPSLGAVYSVRSELHGLRGGRTEAVMTTLSPSLKDYEHLIVVLAASPVTPAGYTHFDRLTTVRLPKDEAFIEEERNDIQHYRVIRPSVERDVPLPSHPLAWTTIAYVFWDGLDPNLLTNLQQQALLDWLHWGGQLILDGPNSLDKLKGSFLAPYLPADVTQTVKLDQSAFDELNATFSLRSRKRGDDAPKGENLRRITILPDREMLGVEWKLAPGGHPVAGTGGLVAERRTGGGRIVATRFLLSDVRIKQWKNFDGFFNAVFLRRPARVFGQESELAGLTVKWADPAVQHMFLEPRLGTTLRYFSRDIGSLATYSPPPSTAATTDQEEKNSPAAPRRGGPAGGISGAPVYGSPGVRISPYSAEDEPRTFRPETWTNHPDIDDWHFCGYQSTMPSGVAAWNDTGAASEAARQSLTEAAGIQIPRGEFVLQVLGIYLLVLVPVNWLIFWLIGRVEWAWVAAPIIAVLGAGAVIRLAQLDIGFARSRTEIGILEVQGGYERAHLTRYSALYTSLSSNYALTFDEFSALALPFASGPRNESLLSISTYTDVAFRREKETANRLAGVQVSSNSTGMVHSEQMLPLGKSPKVTESLQLIGDDRAGFAIRNTTDVTLRDVGVFRRVDAPTPNGQPDKVLIETAYVAKIDPATSAPLRFSPPAAELEIDAETGKPLHSYPAVWLPEWDQTNAFARSDAQLTSADKGRVRLHRLARLAAQGLRLLPGDVRLVGWTNDRLPGLSINPEAPQNSTFTLVLAHLARGPLPPVKPDRNIAEDYYTPMEEPEPDQPNLTPSEPSEP
jgi:hypothetical protein